jgi:hypothetical protein
MKIDVAMILGIAAVAGVVAVAGCRQMSESEPSKTAGVAERTDSPVLLSPTPREAIAFTSPILMVWRDPATGKLTSRTLQRETKENITTDFVADSRTLQVTMPLRVDTRAVAAAK